MATVKSTYLNMKIIIFIKKFWLIFLLSIIAVVGGYFYFFAPKPAIPPTLIPKPTPVPTIPIIPPPLDTGLPTTNQIIWRLDKLDLPGKLSILYFDLPSSNPQTYSPIAQTLGIAASPANLPSQPVIIFSQADGSADFYVNLRDKTAHYTINALINPLPTTGTKINPSGLTTQLTNLLSPVLRLPEDISLSPGEIKYQTIADERFVPASPSTATVYQVTLNYRYGSYPLTHRGVPAIQARYSVYGPLINLRLSLPGESYTKSQDFPLLTFDEIKLLPPNKFEVIFLSGSRAFELSDQSEVIKSTTITSGYLGYLISPDSSAVVPYVFFTGAIQSKTYGTVTVTLATPAIKF